MISWILAQQLALSMLLLLLLLLHRPLLMALGARTLYAFWLSVPLLLLTSALASHLPWAVATVDVVVVKDVAKQVQQVQQQLLQYQWLNWVWLVGAMAVVTVMVLLQLALRGLLAKARPMPAFAPLSPPVRYLQSDQLAGPHISGFFTPTVLLPQDFCRRFTPQQQQLILRHELTHWQRGDLHWNYLALALLILCWFNPLIWIAYRRYRQDQELACDAVVLKDAHQQDRIAYGYALVSNLQQPASTWQPLIYHYTDKHLMKQRLIQLQHAAGFSKSLVLVGLALVAGSALWLQQTGYAVAEPPRPQLRIEPKYPIQAAAQRISGYVQAQFDIHPDGHVSDVKIIKAEPANTFEREAITALTQWTYQPSRAGYKGARVQLDFMLDPPLSGLEQIKVTAKSE